jgi:hypothetical protein
MGLLAKATGSSAGGDLVTEPCLMAYSNCPQDARILPTKCMHFSGTERKENRHLPGGFLLCTAVNDRCVRAIWWAKRGLARTAG